MATLRQTIVKLILRPVVIAAVIVLNLGLLWQNHQLRRQLAADVPTIGLGQRVDFGSFPPAPVDSGIDMDATVLLVMSPYCDACSAQAAGWGRLVASSQPSLRIEAVMDESFAEVGYAYLVRVGLEQIPLRLAPSADLERTGLTATPTTVIVSPQGIVKAVWVGVWTPTIEAEVERTTGLAAGALGGGGDGRTLDAVSYGGGSRSTTEVGEGIER